MENQRLLINIPCQELHGVGPHINDLLKKIGIQSVHDLLFHLPLRYQDRTRVTAIRDLRLGDDVVVEGDVQSCQITVGRRRSLVCRINDRNHTLTLQFFNFSFAQKKNLEYAKRIRCYGQVRQGYRGEYVMIHPEYQHVNDKQLREVNETLTPIYPTTEGLGQQVLRNLTEQALNLLQQEAFLHEGFPETLRQKFQLTCLSEAIHYVHRPPPDASQELLQQGKHPMQQRY